LLDVLGKLLGQPVSALLAGDSAHVRESVAVNAVIGGSTIEETIRSAHGAIAEGYPCLKLKVGQQGETGAQTIERVRAIRAAIGLTVQLRLDANASWSFEQAVSILQACAECDIQYVEQPLPADDLTGMRVLRQTVPIPIAADEAVTDLASARHILDQSAADVLILKPQLLGGLRTAQRIVQMAFERHVNCTITSALETGIGMVALLHLVAATPAITEACGLGTLSLLDDTLLEDDLLLRQGNIVVPIAPGLGLKANLKTLTKGKS
jgi:o-succinylbenzoate synthase